MVTLNGVALSLVDIAKKKRKSGVTLLADDGTRHYVQRVTSGGAAIIKHEWELSTEGVSNTMRAAIEAIANLSSTMVFVDENGANYTVQCESESYQHSVAFIDGAGIAYYTVRLTIYEP